MAAYPKRSVTAGWARWATLVALVLPLAAACIAVLLPTPGMAQASSVSPQTEVLYQVTVAVGPGTRVSLPIGGSATLPIAVTVAGPQPLAAASVLIEYDPMVVHPVSCVPRAGAPAGLCNTAYQPENGLIRFNLLSGSGLMGNVGLFDLTFDAAPGAARNAESLVTPLIESLADVQGNMMSSVGVGSSIRLASDTGTGTIVYVGPPALKGPIAVPIGTTVTVPVWITPVTGLAAGSFELSFDPAVLRPLACRPLPAIHDGSGSGVCALHADHVRASILSQAGLSGEVLAFEVDFAPAGGALAGATSALDISVETLTDINGDAILSGVRPATAKIAAGDGSLPAILRIAPVTQSLYDDAVATVHVFLDSGQQVRAAAWGIHYDPAVLRVDSCEVLYGFSGAVCNPTAGPGLIRMSLLSTDPLGSSVDVALIHFRRNADAPGGSQSTLTFDVTDFADLAGNQLPYRTVAADIKLFQAWSGSPAVVARLGGAPTGGFKLARGASLDLPIVLDIDPLQPVGSLTGSLHYNPAVLRPTRCVRNGSGDADAPMGYCNAQYDPQAGIIRFTLLSANGVSASLTPFTVNVEAVTTANNGDTSPLDLSIEALTGPLGQSLTWQSHDTNLHLTVPVTAARVLVGPPGVDTNGAYTLTLGATQTVPVWIEGVSALGAATISIGYDPQVALATGCRIRYDLVPGIDGGSCALATQAHQVRANFLSVGGYSGTGRVLEITFVRGLGPACNSVSPLTVTVDNFVSVAEVPIPSIARQGRLGVFCATGPTPDLVVDSVAVQPAVPGIGTQATALVVIRNQGGAAITKTVSTAIYFNLPPAGDPLAHAEISGLGAGMSAALDIPFVPDASGINLPLAAWVDFNNGVVESDENNNQNWTMIQVAPGATCYTLTKAGSPLAGGTVSVSPPPNCNGGTGYTAGTVLTVSATANDCYTFSGWSGDLAGSTNPTPFSMLKNASISAAFAASTPPRVGDLAIERSGTDVLLTWSQSGGCADHYEVWRATNTPYFDPADAGATKLADVPAPASGSPVSHTDPDSGIGDPAGNSYYLVRAVHAGGSASSVSNRVGAFTFAWTLGRYNPMSLALAVPGITTAEQLASYIAASTGTNVSQLLKWDPSLGSAGAFLSYEPGSDFSDNFATNVADPYLVFVPGSGSAELVLAGDVPGTGSVSFNLLGASQGCRYNYLSVPLDHSFADAAALAGDIGNVSQLLSWDAALGDSGIFLSYEPGSDFSDNFAVRSGYPYLLCTPSSATWP